MIKFKLITAKEWRLEGRPNEEAFVYLDLTDATQDAEIQYEGPEQLVNEIKSHLIGSYGERGRIISDQTSGYDLNNAMHNWTMAPFDPELVEGRELLRGSD